MLLARYDGQNLHWVSKDKIVLVTRNGLIMRTVGLPENLKGSQVLGSHPLIEGGHRLMRPVRAARILDFGEKLRYSIQVDSVVEPLGQRRIHILGLEFEVMLLRERATARARNWQFENFYWVDKYDGRVWRTRQHVGRSMPPIDIEILKPAA